MNEHPHMFESHPGWWLHRKSWMRWQCVSCGYKTRAYDAADRLALRPIHPYMSVAYVGYNAIGGYRA